MKIMISMLVQSLRNQSLIKDAINSEVSNFTIEEMKSNPEDVQQAILERLQKLFNSRFIVKVTFDNIVYQ